MYSLINEQIWNRLLRGGSLEGLALPLKHGRTNLGNLLAPQPNVRQSIRTPIADAAMLENISVVTGTVWESLDFSGSRLNGLRFFDCAVRNCVFDECSCQDWRLWSTAISDTCFCHTDLRSSALGGATNDGNRNSFCNVQFDAADLRKTCHNSAQFVGCKFKHSRLDKVDFGGSTFENCTFEGELCDVQFYKTGFSVRSFRRITW